MFKIVDDTMLRCQMCPNFIPIMDTTVCHTDGKALKTYVKVRCEHHELCRSIEKYLLEDCKYGRE